MEFEINGKSLFIHVKRPALPMIVLNNNHQQAFGDLRQWSDP